MTAQYGRTTSQWTAFKIEDAGNTIRSIAVNSINGVGLTYPQLDLTAFKDAIHGALPETPDCVITIGGVFDTDSDVGTHTVLSGIVGGVTPLTLDVQVGIRHAWEALEPQFGASGTATSGFLCRAYDPNLDDMSFTAEFGMYPGSTAPAWGVGA